jgi:tRNA nucleotidyltransferase (CCA-adding enzyme)
MAHASLLTEQLPANAVPEAVRALMERLRQRGYEALLVGGGVRELLLGRPAADFDVSTSAAPETVLQIFERAIPIGLRHGTVMVPTAAGPVDVTTFRGGPRCEDDLAKRDFTINAVAWDPVKRELIDPFGGVRDLRTRCLRAVGSAQERFREDPLRALRAARLVASLQFEPDAAIEPAMTGVRGALGGVARERVRSELAGVLVAPRVEAGLGMLRRSGIEADLAPGVGVDAHRVVQALRPDLVLRLTGWLRETDAAGILGRLRFPSAVTRRVDLLVRLHPVERHASPERNAELRRLLRRAGDENLELLITLSEAELRVAPQRDAERAAARLETIAQLRAGLERVRRFGSLALHRSDLALDGREVMHVLRCGPGPLVGEALGYLTERVIEAPGCNNPDELRALLSEWRSSRGAPGVSSRKPASSEEA